MRVVSSQFPVTSNLLLCVPHSESLLASSAPSSAIRDPRVNLPPPASGLPLDPISDLRESGGRGILPRSKGLPPIVLLLVILIVLVIDPVLVLRAHAWAWLPHRRSGTLYVIPAPHRHSGTLYVIPAKAGIQAGGARGTFAIGGCSLPCLDRDLLFNQQLPPLIRRFRIAGHHEMRCRVDSSPMAALEGTPSSSLTQDLTHHLEGTEH